MIHGAFAPRRGFPAFPGARTYLPQGVNFVQFGMFGFPAGELFFDLLDLSSGDLPACPPVLLLFVDLGFQDLSVGWLLPVCLLLPALPALSLEDLPVCLWALSLPGLLSEPSFGDLPSGLPEPSGLP